MGRVRKVTGEDVMSEDEFAAWWSEHHLQGEAFVDVLRRYLATKLQLKNFRQLALVCGDAMLSPESHWTDAELVVVIRPFLPDADGLQALVQAASNGDVAGVMSLLERPLDPDAEADDENSDDSDTFEVTPLQMAAAGGHLEVVCCLLAASADVDKADCNGWTALLSAAEGGHTKVVHCLVQAGADKDKTGGPAGMTPMHLATICGHQQVVHCLLQAGAEKDKTDSLGRTPMRLAAEHGRWSLFQALVSYKLSLSRASLCCTQ